MVGEDADIIPSGVEICWRGGGSSGSHFLSLFVIALKVLFGSNVHLWQVLRCLRLYSTVGLFSIPNNYPCPEFCMSTQDFFVLYLFRLRRFSPPVKFFLLKII